MITDPFRSVEKEHHIDMIDYSPQHQRVLGKKPQFLAQTLKLKIIILY